MLIRATIENFKSFNESTELVMVSSSKIRRKEDHVKLLQGAKVLKYAAVYGANAAGKSNLIDFFRFFQQTLTQGLGIATSSLYCRNSESNRDKQSTFEIQFSANGHVFAYGFTALLYERRVLEEWLYELGSSHPKTLLLRDTAHGKPIVSDVEFTSQEKTRFETYAEDFSHESARLFLSELNRSKRYVPGSSFQVFVDAFEWLTARIVVVSPTQPPRDAKYLLSEEGVDRAGKLLGSFDTGISEIYQEPMSLEAFSDAVSEQYLVQMREEVDARLRASDSGKIRGCLQTSDGFYFFDIDGAGISNITVLRLRHHNVAGLFDYREESDGTKRLFDLMNILLDENDDVAFVVDELERSLHPMLVRHFLELFMERNATESRQLVFSSHEASIMDQELFRRDEIWFVDRGSDANSRLYSLDRFKDRFDKDIAKAYLEGRYGAVPAFVDYRREW